jgi:hypothetical protein
MLTEIRYLTPISITFNTNACEHGLAERLASLEDVLSCVLSSRNALYCLVVLCYLLWQVVVD